MKFSYDTGALLSKTDIKEQADSLMTYAKRLKESSEQTDYAEPENSLHLPFDEEILKRVREMATSIKTNTLQYVVVIGIGGSNLGAQAVYDAVAGSMNLLVDRLPKLLFLDTVSDEKMTAVTRTLERLPKKDDFAVIVISKSGSTTETIVNTEVLWAFLQEHFGDPRSRFVAITDEGSKLWNQAGEKKMARLSIPGMVGGRYSVFTAVGLLPLLLAGISVEELRGGAQQAVQESTHEDLTINTALTSAIITDHHRRAHRTIHNSFLFSPKLESLGKWYRQLMAESLGKDGKGITPILSIGSTDLHSQAQLYFAGPDDKYTNLLYSMSGDVNQVPQYPALSGLVPDISNKSLEQVMKAIVGGEKASNEKLERPYVEIDLDGIGAYELGYYLQWRMIEVMYLAQLMHVNAFDQPEVELYKTETRRLLKGGT
jgi:glucose-6-phosphate isomerase